MYNATYWLDRVVDEETEEVIQEGTDQSAGHFNNMEEGISDAHLATALLLISASLSADQVATEEQTITLENSESFPFNNSVETVRRRLLLVEQRRSRALRVSRGLLVRRRARGRVLPRRPRLPLLLHHVPRLPLRFYPGNRVIWQSENLAKGRPTKAAPLPQQGDTTWTTYNSGSGSSDP